MNAIESLLDMLDTDHRPAGLVGDLFEPVTATSTHREVSALAIDGLSVPQIVDEFWTAKQRDASSLHEISYRACFKPQLPRYFIRRFTSECDTVYDPFGGRGTTAIEAALMRRVVIVNDVNPLSRILTEGRLAIPSIDSIAERLAQVSIAPDRKADVDLSMFYDPRTEAEIVALRTHLNERKGAGLEDGVDRWIRMVATNRLTGHSPGFFSVYSFPPNQAVSAERQKRINERRRQTPEYRDTRAIILKKSQSLLSNVRAEDIENLRAVAERSVFLTCDARMTQAIPASSVRLTVTSPPFLDVVQYAADNWLRCWFNGIDVQQVARTITMSRTVEKWNEVMSGVLEELYRVTVSGGRVASTLR